jgi:hypothetical protein
MKTLKLILILLLFNLTSFYSSSQVAPFVAVHATDSNGVPNCQQLDTNICFTIFQHSGILDAVNNGLFLMDYNTLTFAIPDWYSDDGVSFYYWSGSGWNPCVEYCGLLPIVINGDSVVYANANHSYSVIDTSGSSYYWVVTNGNILSGQGSGNLQVQWNSQGNGLITLIQTSLNGCVDTLLMNITILGNVSTHEYYSKSIVAFPNPTRNQVNIGGLNGPVCVEVFDVNGRLLMTTKNKIIDLASFTYGHYVLKVMYADKVEYIQVVKN